LFKKKHLIFITFISLIFCNEKSIIVYQLDSAKEIQDKAVWLTDRLEIEFIKQGEYKVVDRKQIEEIFEEQGLQLSGSVYNQFLEAGRIIGANYLISGSIIGSVLEPDTSYSDLQITVFDNLKERTGSYPSNYKKSKMIISSINIYVIDIETSEKIGYYTIDKRCYLKDCIEEIVNNLIIPEYQDSTQF